ncbi:MAG: VacJ family lipoprotein [bacterium]|nr:VacJ family lipoprotein [Gammaproteobacteria bacterium]HIL94299.1 VacJ family lipoprotein [Pseudomonadales bacterium]
MKNVSVVWVLLILGPGLAAGQGDEIAKDPDPWSGFNQSIYRFNNTADKYVLKPVATGYKKLPGPIRKSVNNFFENLADVENGVNGILQGKVLDGVSDLGRILINTTVGIGGLFDPASRIGLQKHEEDFGQTLSVWGLPPGPYVVLPFLGPRRLTHALTNPLNPRLDPIRYYYPVAHRNVMWGIRAIDNRSDLLVAESLIFGDRYIFIRDAYIQRRDYLIADGVVEDDFDDF